MKNNLPWLSLTDRNALYVRFEKTVESALLARHWGVLRRRVTAQFDHTELYILDMRGLFLAVGILRHLLDPHEVDIYYRGQTTAHTHLTPSLYRTSGSEQLTLTEKAQREKRLEVRLDAISSVFDTDSPRPSEREALAQHYGLPTRCLDVLDHVQTAAWFACDQPRPSQRDAVGHIYILAADRKEHYTHVVDLRRKPSNWLRPHMQQAHMLFTGPKANTQRDFDFTCLAHFIIPRPLLRIWSNYGHIGKDAMYPAPEQDDGARYWKQAFETLVGLDLIPPHPEMKITP